MRIKVSTYFDITETGVSRTYKGQTLPVKVRGSTITTKDAWTLKRKQQSNLETVIQCLLMRGTPDNITSPVRDGEIWTFSFEISSIEVYGQNLELLMQDIAGIPMSVNLTETRKIDSYLNESNIWFETDV